MQEGNSLSNQHILTYTRSLSMHDYLCTNTLTFDIDEFIGQLHSSGALGYFALRQNYATPNQSDTMLYSPFLAVNNLNLDNCITLGSHIRWTTATHQFDSEYITNFSIDDGTTLASKLTQAGHTSEAAYITSASSYLVIESTFGNFEYVNIDTLTGGGGGSAATVQLTADIDANDNLIDDPLSIYEEGYTAKLILSSDPSHPVDLKHEPVDSVSGAGTDLRFSKVISNNELEIKLLVIDGGEITAQQGGGGAEEPNQGEQ